MKPLLVTLFFFVFSLPCFAQNKRDSLNRIQFIYEISGGVKTFTVSGFNDASSIKMPPAVFYFSQGYCIGKPLSYFISADIGFGVNPGYFFDSKKTFLMAFTYGASLHYGIPVRENFLITPVAGWQNAWASTSFNHFIQNKHSADFKQNNFLVLGCDFSVRNSMFSKAAVYNSVSGIKIFYQLPLASLKITEGSAFFPSGTGSLSLGGFNISVFYRF